MMGKMGSLVGVHNRTGCQTVFRAAVGAFGSAGFCDIKKDTWVHAPEGSFGAWAMQGQIIAGERDRLLVFRRARCLSHCASHENNVLGRL